MKSGGWATALWLRERLVTSPQKFGGVLDSGSVTRRSWAHPPLPLALDPLWAAKGQKGKRVAKGYKIIAQGTNEKVETVHPSVLHLNPSLPSKI